jgi:hypothetical protein
MAKFYFMQEADGSIFQTANPEYHKQAEKLPQAKGKELYRAQCIEKVLALLENVDTVYGIVRHVSASGMNRDIDLYIITDNRPVYLTGYASTILDYPMAKSRGMKVGGCGMDMVFHCVSSLAYAIGRDYETLKSEII